MNKTQDATLQEKVEALELKPLSEAIENGELDALFAALPEEEGQQIRDKYAWISKRDNARYSTKYLLETDLGELERLIARRTPRERNEAGTKEQETGTQ